MIEISAERFRDFINIVEELPQSVKVSVEMDECDIKPYTEYERVRKYITENSQTFDVTFDDKSSLWFQTRKPSKE